MTNSPPSPTASSTRPIRQRRWLKIALITVVVLLVGAELTARWGYGLGDPPLFMSHPEIEYLYQPSQTHYRFGNRVTTNAWSMRSDEFPKTKSDPRELRILVLGDSVANGGAFTDQDDVATVILQRRLGEALKRPVVVGNASAGSWGPPNLLAYVRNFGFFDADFVIILLSNEDYGDVPTFAPLGSSMPEQAPFLALEEVVLRYVPQLLRYQPETQAPLFNPRREDITTSLDALRDLIDEIKQAGARPAVALHAELSELMSMNYKAGAQALAGVANSRQTPVIQLNIVMSKLFLENNLPYRDWIHPNAVGQAAIAESLFQWIMSEKP